LRYADLGIDAGHFAFGFGDVWAAFEQVGRQAGIEWRRLGVQLFAGKVKVWCRLADQHGDGVLELFALLQEKNGLRARGVEKCFFLGDIEARSYSAFVARVHKLQTFLESFDSASEDGDFRIELAQSEIVREGTKY